ncbi:MAG: hypothetical protein ACM339_11905 [Ignavibacteria bacterium]
MEFPNTFPLHLHIHVIPDAECAGRIINKRSAENPEAEKFWECRKKKPFALCSAARNASHPGKRTSAILSVVCGKFLGFLN